MLALEEYMAGTQIAPLHKELIKIRASQINGCAFCIDKHTKDARKLGETEQRIYLLNAWHEAEEHFSEEERIILAMTEEITLIHRHGLSSETYQKAVAAINPAPCINCLTFGAILAAVQVLNLAICFYLNSPIKYRCTRWMHKCLRMQIT